MIAEISIFRAQRMQIFGSFFTRLGKKGQATRTRVEEMDLHWRPAEEALEHRVIEHKDITEHPKIKEVKAYSLALQTYFMAARWSAPARATATDTRHRGMGYRRWSSLLT